MSGGPNPNAWHNWYHAVGSTYGTWLRGDPRGFRTFQHRQHVEGDYRHPPPPGVFAPIFEISKTSLRHPPVRLTIAQRQWTCLAMVDKFEQDKVEVLALAIMSNHFHLEARFPLLTTDQRRRCAASLLRDGRDPAPRHFIGRARKHASFVLRDQGLKPGSPVWGVRPKMDPNRDRQHQVNIVRYIQGHVEEGGAVYLFDRGFLFQSPGMAIPGR